MTTADATTAWGAESSMNPIDTVMWRVEADPTLRAPTLSCEQLDTVPDWDRFVAAHEWAVRVAPRFRQRVVEPVLGLGVPRWTEDPQFDLPFHLRRQRLPEGGGWPELMEALAQFLTTPLDRARAPWEAVLFSGLPEGRALYALKMHHAVADGLGVLQLLARLHSRSREPTPRKPEPAVDPTERIGALDALLRQARDDLGAVPGLAREAGAGALRALTDPLGTARAAGRYGLSLRRVLDPPIGTGSPLLAGRSMRLRLAGIDVPFADLRAAARAAGGSVNDAFLAALLGGYRRYHQAMGAPVVESVPTAIPVSVRKPDDPEGGNRIASARLAGPVAEADPAARIGRIRARLGAARAEPALDVIGVVSPALARLPAPLVARVAGPMTRANDLQASNVPGIGEGYHLAGARVERFFGYGPLGGSAAMITMVSHGSLACVGVGFDAAAFTEPRLFLDSLVDGFAEVLALHPGAGPPVLRG